jgi:hypothetical protein
MNGTKLNIDKLTYKRRRMLEAEYLLTPMPHLSITSFLYIADKATSYIEFIWKTINLPFFECIWTQKEGASDSTNK